MEYGVFDILGPIMTGPSSSHTAGAVKIARLALALCDFPIANVEFHLHGSFAKTYKGHGTDKALVAGILGFSPGDKGIRTAFETADAKGLRYQFIPTDLGDVHENTVKIVMFSHDGNQSLTVIGCSIGGGEAVITSVNDYPTRIDGKSPTLMIEENDNRGVVAKVSTILADAGINIAAMQVERKAKYNLAMIVVQTDELPDEQVVKRLMALNDVFHVRLLNYVL